MPSDDSKSSDCVSYEDTVALAKWRQAVSAATSSSQLAVCVNQLEKCIAWEKSPMKVVCTCTCTDTIHTYIEESNSEVSYYIIISLTLSPSFVLCVIQEIMSHYYCYVTNVTEAHIHIAVSLNLRSFLMEIGFVMTVSLM